MSWSGLAKFLIGFFLAIALLVGGGVATAYYFFTKLSIPPPRPTFANDKPAVKVKSPQIAAKKASSPTAQGSPTTASSEVVNAQELEPGAYKARISWREGLSLREEPSLEANKVGGVAYNQRVVVIKQSDDQKWQQIRLEDSEQKGWVKAGNIERVDEEQPQ